MIKRLFDILYSTLALILLSPVILIVAYNIQRKLGSPVLFSQDRPGKNGTIFKMIKFRTMKDAYDPNGKPLPDSERMTSFGKLLRSTSLDELPGLWNVLKGDMSLVGPRPLLVEYLPLYSKEQARRHNVRPGITGWAQVNGRNAISWEEKFKLDCFYVDNQSFWLDIKILFKTVKKVITRDGITQKNHVTSGPFLGEKMKEGKIYSGAKIISPEKLVLGVCSQIDDFCFINTGKGCLIGRNVHIASFSSITGGGVCEIGDFSGLSAGCRLLTASDDFIGPFLTNPTVPSDFTNVMSARVKIGRHVILGANSVVFPGVSIGDGVAVGAGSVIRKDLDAWGIYVMKGNSLVKIRDRNQTEILKQESKYLDSLSG